MADSLGGRANAHMRAAPPSTFAAFGHPYGGRGTGLSPLHIKGHTMIEAILIAVLFGVGALCYQLGVMDGETREYKKWYARQWHRPGCSCDDIESSPK